MTASNKPRSSIEIAVEIAQRELFAQEYPAAMTTVNAATYRYDTKQLVLAYGDALVAERAREERALVLAPVLRRMLDAEREATAPKSVCERADAA